MNDTCKLWACNIKFNPAGKCSLSSCMLWGKAWHHAVQEEPKRAKPSSLCLFVSTKLYWWGMAELNVQKLVTGVFLRTDLHGWSSHFADKERLFFYLLSWLVWQQLVVLSQETREDWITNLMWMSNNLLVSTSYMILFLLRLKVLYRNGHLNPFTEKRSKTQGSEVTFVELQSCPRGNPHLQALSPASCSHSCPLQPIFIYLAILADLFTLSCTLP